MNNVQERTVAKYAAAGMVKTVAAIRRGVSRQRMWQVACAESGRCMQCGKPRPPELQLRCRACQDKWNIYQRALCSTGS